MHHEVPIIAEGWVGKPEGMLQILYGRSFLNPAKINLNKLQGRKIEYYHTIPDTSLKEMVNFLVNFSQEETLLQYYGRLLGVIVDRTPKCHYKIAGKGVEYDWAAAKISTINSELNIKGQKQFFWKVLRIAPIET